jgi:hypothetical protein
LAKLKSVKRTSLLQQSVITKVKEKSGYLINTDWIALSFAIVRLAYFKPPIFDRYGKERRLG